MSRKNRPHDSEMMGLEKPEEMTGESLLIRKPGM